MPDAPLTTMLVVVGDPPEGSTRTRGVLRVVLNVVRWYPDVEFTLVLRGDAARALLPDVPAPAPGEESLEKLLDGVAYRRGTIAVVDTWLEDRGLTARDLPRGTEVCTAKEVAQLTLLADGVVIF